VRTYLNSKKASFRVAWPNLFGHVVTNIKTHAKNQACHPRDAVFACILGYASEKEVRTPLPSSHGETESEALEYRLIFSGKPVTHAVLSLASLGAF
jgi:hypothetical protein